MPLYYPPGGSEISWGGDATGTGTTAFWVPPGYTTGGMGGLASPIYRRATHRIKISRLYVFAATAPVGNSLTFTLHKGAVGAVSSTALAVTLATTVQTGEDTTDEITIEAGELFGVQVTFGGAITQARQITVNARLDPA